MNTENSVMVVSSKQIEDARIKIETLTRESAIANFATFLGKRARVNPKTLTQYHSQIKTFLDWCNSKQFPAWQATTDDIETFVAYLDSECLTKTGLKLKVATKNSRITTVRRFFKALQDQGYRLDNPCFGVKSIADNTDSVAKMKCLETGDIKLLLDAAAKFTPKNKVRNQAAIVLMSQLGLRGFEVCNIQRKDIDTSQHVITIHGKRAKIRITGMSPAQFKYIQDLLEITLPNPNSYLFVNRSAKIGKAPNLTPRGLRLMIDTLMKKVTIKRAGASSHSLRHTCGVALRKAGKSLEDIALLFGHQNINTTSIYTKYNDLVINPISAAIDKYLS